MNSVEGEFYPDLQGTLPVVDTVTKEASERLQGDKLKTVNSTPNGYSSVPNHKTKVDGSLANKLNDSSKMNEYRNSDSTKHSDHVKKKDSSSSSHKHSSSKPKDISSVSKDGSNKVHSSKPSDPSKPKEHDKEKKHSSSSVKTKDSVNHSVKKDSVKMKSDDKSGIKSEIKSSSDKSKSDNFKENQKIKDEKVKKHHHEHKDKIKEKSKDHEKHKEIKLKKPEDGKEKAKDKMEEKVKEKSSEKVKEKSSEKLKEKSSEKLKEKSSEKLKEKSSEKPKEKSSEKLKEKSGEKVKEKCSEKVKEKSGEKVREKSSEKLKEKSEKLKHSTGEKVKEKHKESSEKHVKEHSVKNDVERKIKGPVVIKAEPVIEKVKDEPLSDDDLPLSARTHVMGVKVKSEKPEKTSVKRERIDTDDEAPLSARLDKVKKIKTENSAKKRKAVSDEDYDDQYDSDYKKPAKKIKKSENKKKVKEEKKVKDENVGPKKRKKQEEQQDVWKWWEEEKHSDGVKWNTLEHNGPVFAPAYERVPKNVKFYYDGKHMELSETAEEVAGFYGRMLDHEYTTKESFNTNFFKDWRKVMSPEEKEIIKDLKKCNFKDFNVYYKMKSEERKNMSKEEKLEIRRQNEELVQKYGFCVIDGHRQKIGNFKIEPPGLFRGRGEHPKMGMLKRRVVPEDILINIGKEAKVPEPPAGHRWKEIRHDNTVTWLASWNENILNSTKYIMLNPSSKLKGEKDWQKYETARKLKNHADRIRQTYTEDFKSKEMRVRQRAVALYFIDKLALRAGNEKDEDTADTVGCCSLRVEHITLHEEKDGKEYVVDFDFLGKDSIRYVNSVAVEKRAFKNVKLFMENKQPGDDIFDRLNTSILNKYLNELMEGLTAKVFRTYNASKTLQEQLELLTKEEMSIPEKILAYNRANRAVAILCNHQRSVPKGFSKSMENLKNKMDEKIQQIKEFKKEVKKAKQAHKDTGSAKDKMVYDKKKKRLQQLEEQLKKLEVQATDREENKQIALGTSKLNYLDPRISVAWCKKWDVPIEKIYNKTQRDKFLWAIEMAGPDFHF